jgi:hypothetical protein
MSKLNPDPLHRPGPAPFQTADDGTLPDTDPDFADEHNETTFADELDGGPEGAREPESPRGRGGMED